ncbi:MAG: hypothetical protein LBK41_04050 [Clostridiales bacterium]|nr:hypothetical protein [Clostridiales bacterium]
MEKIKDYLAAVEDQLDKIENVIEGGKSSIFSGRVSVSRESVFDIVDEIRNIKSEIEMNLPAEIRTAARIASDREKIIADAKIKADALLKEARAEADKALNEHEIIRQATAKAQQLETASRASAAKFRKDAIEYSEELLQKTEEAIRRVLENFADEARGVEDYLTAMTQTLFDNRKDLRGIKE